MLSSRLSTYHRIIGAIVATIFALISSNATASIVVVGNRDLSFNHLSANQIAAIYSGKVTEINHQAVTPVDLLPSSPSYVEFYQSMLGWSPSQVSEYWSQQVFSGSLSQPNAVQDLQSAIALARSTPGGLAYFDPDKIQQPADMSGLKVLYGQAPSSSEVKTPNSNRSAEVGDLSGRGDRFFSNFTRRISLDLHHSSRHSKHARPKRTTLALPPVPRADNLWFAISQHFALRKDFNLPAVQHERSILLQHPARIKSMVNNSIPYIAYVYEQCVKHHEPSELALLPMLESSYDPFSYSKTGATGLWQMMPQTAVLYGLKISWWYDFRRDVLLSTGAALNYLSSLHGQFKTWPLAFAGYNSGAKRVATALSRASHEGGAIGLKFLGYLPQETQRYVPKLLAIASIIDNPSRYRLQLPPLTKKSFFTSVTLQSQMSFTEISRMSGVSENLLRFLNPGIRRYATSPEGNYTLLLPVHTVPLFLNNLHRLIGHHHLSWQYHEVHRGESLNTISRDYHVSKSKLRDVNHLENDALSPGQGLLVPLYLGSRFKDILHIGTKQQVAHIQPARQRVNSVIGVSSRDPLKPILDASSRVIALAQVAPWKYWLHSIFCYLRDQQQGMADVAMSLWIPVHTEFTLLPHIAALKQSKIHIHSKQGHHAIPFNLSLISAQAKQYEPVLLALQEYAEAQIDTENLNVSSHCYSLATVVSTALASLKNRYQQLSQLSLSHFTKQAQSRLALDERVSFSRSLTSHANLPLPKDTHAFNDNKVQHPGGRLHLRNNKVPHGKTSSVVPIALPLPRNTDPKKR